MPGKRGKVARESEELFRTLADAAPAMLWTSDPAGSAVFLSRGWCEFTGQTETEALGLGWTEAVHPADRGRSARIHLEANQRREPFSLDYRLRRRDGEYRWTIDSGRPHFAPDGTFLGYVGSVIDIHERKLAEELLRERQAWQTGQKEALQAALNGAPLEASLGVLVRTAVEQLGEGTRAAFYLANTDGTFLYHVVGMPDEYAACVDGFTIGPDSLACGLATHTGQPVLTADVRTESRWQAWLWLAERFDYRGCWSFPIHTSARMFVGTLTVYSRLPREATPHDLELASLLIETASIIISRDAETEARNRAEALVESELVDAKLLQSISAHLIEQDEIQALYGKIIDAAVSIMRSDFASMQMLYPDRGKGGELRLLAFSGFDPEAAKFWEWVRTDSSCACGVALRTGRRAIVTDVENCESMAGSDDQTTYQRAGIRAVQSTPLVSRSGKLVGMISTHWRNPHNPSEHDLRLFDILARQAADLIDRSQAQEALRESDRRKDEFIATLSHELRNPLAPLHNAVELLCRPDSEGVALAPIRDMMKRQLNQLVRLVDDLLEISRINAGTLELRKERVELATVVRNALETSDPLVSERNHELTLSLPEDPLWIEGDLVRLAQILANLVNNAAKYTNPGGRIEVRARRRDGVAEISVHDNGQGIAGETLPRLFGMFSRGQNLGSHGQGGLGIGLALSRRLAEMHGGTIVASSPGPGKGSDFVVRLPLADPRPEQPRHEPISRAILPRQRILVVDDNVDAAESLWMILDFLGAEARIANDGPQALEIFESFRPDVVLLDIGMPGMDGYEVARRMRKRLNGDPVRLVALTGWGQENDRRRAHEAGFDHHLVKPAEVAALKTLLASFHSDHA